MDHHDGDGSGRFIDGVFNYCDRWCDRCPLTDRCQLFAMEPPAFDTVESRDPACPQFWNALSLCFALANRRLRERAARTGEEPPALARGAVGAPADGGDELAHATRSHPLVVGAAAYGHQVDRWFDARVGLLAERERQVADHPTADGRAGLRRVRECVEIVLWYQHLIEIKTALAVATRLDLERHPGEREPYAEHMMNGSAKVALLGVDCSLAAWRTLRDEVADPADTALPLLCRLDRMRRDTEAAFPEARGFRRPGFDAPAGAATVSRS